MGRSPWSLENHSSFLKKRSTSLSILAPMWIPAIRKLCRPSLPRHMSHMRVIFGKQFGQTIKGFFTDEVGLLSRIPWSPRLPAFFREHYGYELVDSLPAVALWAGGKDCAGQISVLSKPPSVIARNLSSSGECLV